MITVEYDCGTTIRIPTAIPPTGSALHHTAAVDTAILWADMEHDTTCPACTDGKSMSYDIWLEIDTGGPEPAQVTEDRNMTSNLSPMWRAAGCDLADLHNTPAGAALPQLRAAITELTTNPHKYTHLNPANGWGTREDCVRYLQELERDFSSHPNATIRVSRRAVLQHRHG